MTCGNLDSTFVALIKGYKCILACPDGFYKAEACRTGNHFLPPLPAPLADRFSAQLAAISGAPRTHPGLLDSPHRCTSYFEECWVRALVVCPQIGRKRAAAAGRLRAVAGGIRSHRAELRARSERFTGAFGMFYNMMRVLGPGARFLSAPGALLGRPTAGAHAATATAQGGSFRSRARGYPPIFKVADHDFNIGFCARAAGGVENPCGSLLQCAALRPASELSRARPPLAPV